MMIDISQLFGKKGAVMPLCVSETVKETLDYPDVVKFLEPVKMEGNLTNVDEVLLLEAKGQTTLSIPCGRCLTPVKVEVQFVLNEKFRHAGEINEEIETFSGDTIELDDLVKRSIVANIPMKVLCTEDCKGLCPVCGQNLNEKECGCDTTELDPRFASLRALFPMDEEV